jgi:hypothetical protein
VEEPLAHRAIQRPSFLLLPDSRLLFHAGFPLEELFHDHLQEKRLWSKGNVRAIVAKPRIKIRPRNHSFNDNFDPK